MIFRDSSAGKRTRKNDRSFIGRLRDKRRRQERRLLSETLENRQLLAGPDLIGIQNNEGELIRGGETLTVAPRELVFRFDDNTALDPLTVAAGIRITRAGEDGGFESATGTSDLGSGGQVLLEFRALVSGAAGNGIEVRVSARDRGTAGQSVGVTVDAADRIIGIELNSNSVRPTTVTELINAVRGNAAASSLIEVLQVSGPSLFEIGRNFNGRVDVELAGANAAQFVSNLGTNNTVRARFVAQASGADGVGTTLTILRGTSTQVDVNDKNVTVTLPAGATVSDLIQAINTDGGADGAARVIFAQLEVGSGATVLPSNIAPLTLVGATDVVVKPGFIGLGDSPHEVVFRFADSLPQDRYQIDVIGSGALALTNVFGEPVNDGENLTRIFSVNTAPQVAAVVPAPVKRLANGTLSPELNVIEVFFTEAMNADSVRDPNNYQLIYGRETATNLDDHIIRPASVSYDPTLRLARLTFTDALSRVRDPQDPTRFMDGAARLRIGSNQAANPSAPIVQTVPVNVEPGDSFGTALPLTQVPFSATNGEVRSLVLNGEIRNTDAFPIQFPGGGSIPGVRQIRPEDDTRLDRTVPLDVWRRNGDNQAGISTIFYDFPADWRGDEPGTAANDTTKRYINLITEEQKNRIREVLSLYSQYLGVQFIETSRVGGQLNNPAAGNHISIAVGELYGATSLETSNKGGLTVATRPIDATGLTFTPDDPDAEAKRAVGNQLLVMDFQDFDASIDDQLGGAFFRGAFFGLGQSLGYGYADHLPQPVTQSTQSVLNPSSDNEPLFPSPSDIVNGQYLFRPESNDIDLYQFNVPTGGGKISIQTIAERMESASLLDTAIRLYQKVGDGWQEIAANDDYFSNDSLIEIEGLAAGDYMIGVSAAGNTVYNPAIPGTGIGGLSEGTYDLRVSFQAAQTSRGLVDAATSLKLDGDMDGEAGGEFNYWFKPSDPINTLYVDSAYTGARTGILGTSSNPYSEIDQAIEAARLQINAQTGALVTRQVRVVGGGTYEIGLNAVGTPLKDGAEIDLPKGVQLVIDAGSTFLMQRSRIGVGSTTEAPTADKSQTSIQVLGTPNNQVVFRSFNSVQDFDLDQLAGKTVARGFQFTAPDPVNNNEIRLFRVDSQSFTFGQSFLPSTGITRIGFDRAGAGDWGGIDIRSDIDSQDESRVNLEERGVFLNHIQYADIRHGGGAVSVAGRQTVVSPIELAVSRATIINSRITDSADAAVSATPDTFAETRFDEFRFQRDGRFTPDFSRVGPHIRGNEIFDNSINGLFIRIETRTGESLENLEVNARFDDIDIVHVLTENLLIEGNAGGPTAAILPPSVLLVQRNVLATGGSIPAGNYDYVITFVNREGYETQASQRITVNAVPAGGAVQFSSLPTLSPALRSEGFTGRRIYRAVSGTNNFVEVGRLNSSDQAFTDRVLGGTTRTLPNQPLIGRFDPSLTIDPGVVLKSNGARIDVIHDAHLFAEGTQDKPIILTSLADNRYGTGGTFDTNSRDSSNATFRAGDWGGIYVGFGGEASFDHVTVAGGGGATRIEGGFGTFNVIEVHQGGLRVANSRFEENSDGRTFINTPNDVRSGRVGRGDNASGAIFVRGAQPIIVNNEFVNNSGPVMSFDINSFVFNEVVDPGRSTGRIDAITLNGNSGPMIAGNRIGTTRLTTDPNGVAALNGLEIRGGSIATEVVLDDVDIVHILRNTIEVPNQHIYGGMRLQSDARGSLVLKLESETVQSQPDSLLRRQAAIVVGGNLITAENEFLDIADRIGGSLQVVGHPDFPVVMTSLQDDTIGAGFTPNGRPNIDTNNNGIRLDQAGNPIFVPTISTSNAPPPPVGLPLSPEYDRTDRAEVDNQNRIDNDIDLANFGFFENTIGYGGEIDDSARATYLNANNQGLLVAANLDYLYTTFIDVDVNFPFANPAPVALSAMAANPPQPILIGPDRVRSTGTFYLQQGNINPVTQTNIRRPVTWVAESFMVNNRSTLYTTLTFETNDGGAFTDFMVSRVDVISYVDQNFGADGQDVLYQKGTPGEADFRAVTVNRDAANRNNAPIIGLSHGGIYANDQINQYGADYRGWAADDIAAQLLGGLELQQFSIDGVLDVGLTQQANEPTIANQTAGTPVLGVGDVATAFKWQLRNSVDEARITSFVEFLPSDPANPFVPPLPPAVDGAGSWDGVTIREAASDSNVGITSENEPSNLGNITFNDTNAIPSRSQFLGELASAVNGGDNARRLGFIVDGTIAQPSDLDVYSFVAEAGTQVWLDIDRTNNRLDTVVELIDENGNIRVLSDSSMAESAGTASRLIGTNSQGLPSFDASAARSLNVNPTASPQDTYSTNPKDAGMRLILPGNVGQRFLYHVRVRSSNSLTPNAPSLISGNVRGGLTTGAYQLQIRLQERDVFAGTQIRYSDVRYAANGVHVLGGPMHSPIAADEYETRLDNNSLVGAQRLGLYEVLYDQSGALLVDRNAGRSANDVRLENLLLNNPAGPLASDRLAKTVAGFMDGITDVDWYQFDIGYQKLTRDDAALYFSTIFDLDYADGAARADTAIFVFDEAGQLILVGGDSNVADDQPGASVDFSDLSRGSFDSGDPFIGAAELIEGSYFVAVSHQSQMPSQLDQFTSPISVNPLLRLEPIDSIRRIAEDHIYGPAFADGFDGTIDVTVGGLGTASRPVVPLLFDQNSIVDYTFDDVILYVNTSGGLHAVNPFTGQNYGLVGGFSDTIQEVAFRSNGELFGYSIVPGVRTDNSLLYYRIDSGTGALSAPLSQGAGITTFEATQQINPVTGAITFTPIVANSGIDLQAMTIAALAGQERGYFVANRAPFSAVGQAAGGDYDENIIYGFTPSVGTVNGPTVTFTGGLSGAGTSPREVGQIFTDAPPINPNFGQLFSQLGITAPTRINNATGLVSPSLVDGDRFTIGDFSSITNRNTVTFEFNSGLTITANQNFPVLDGQTVTIDGTVFEFNTGQRIQLAPVSPLGSLNAGSTVTLSGTNGTPVTFEFVRTGVPTAGNTPISLLAPNNTPLTPDALARSLVAAINANVNLNGVAARTLNDQVVFTGPVTPLVAINGGGLTILGDNQVTTGGAIGINVAETVSPTVLIQRLAEAIRGAGFAVAASGTQLAVPGATSVNVSPAATSALTVAGNVGVTPGNVEIFILPGDTAAAVAQRVANAIEAATDAGALVDVSASTLTADGRQLSNSIRLTNGQVVNAVSANDALTPGGLQLGGRVTGAELVTDQTNGRQEMYAVTNLGELYRVSAGELLSTGPRQVGSLVASATDIAGIPFTALRSGPVSFNDGELRDILFGITGSGDIFAFNTNGEFENVFAGGRYQISTGIPDARGLDFSTLGFNLWHVTERRGSDPGHGINPLFNSARPATTGGSSLAFTYENGSFLQNFPTPAEYPTAFGRQDGTGVEGTYNMPGGAKGVIQSNPFSLRGYAAEDQPALYFNYFLATDGEDGLDGGDNLDGDGDGDFGDQDALRVFVTTPDGVEHLVATNNSLIYNNNTTAIPDPRLEPSETVGIQPLFDNTNSWRQARISLGAFAGQANLSLRIEFSTGGTTGTTVDASGAFVSASLRAKSGDELNDGESFTISDETFSIDLAPTVTIPSGIQIANLYADAAAQAVITVGSQAYVLDDGTRTIATGQIAVPMLRAGETAATLRTLTATQIAERVADFIRLNPPANVQVTGLSFADLQDTNPAAAGGRNDRTFEATSLPYSGGNVTLIGEGQLGNDGNTGLIDPLTAANIVNTNDVDLLRLEAVAGSTIQVDLSSVTSIAIQGAIRFFDASGNVLTPIAVGPNTATLEVGQSGTLFIGISGQPNVSYDPQTGDGQAAGQIGRYRATIAINTPFSVNSEGNLVEFSGLGNVQANSALFGVAPQALLAGIPVPISRFMTPTQVAATVQQVLAERFTAGRLDLIPTVGASIRVPGFSIDDAGPFVNQSTRYTDNLGGGPVVGARSNNFEGVYLDDFIIGFAERGEVATRPTLAPPAVPPVTTFVAVPGASTSGTVTGSYQLEIRDASEYVSSGLVEMTRTNVVLQEAGGLPLIVQINGEIFGFEAGSIPPQFIVAGTAANRSLFLPNTEPLVRNPTVNLPALLADPVLGSQRIADIAGGPTGGANGPRTAFFNLDQLALVKLDANLRPVDPVRTVTTPVEARFRTFDTNDRLGTDITLRARSGAELVDGSSFRITDSRGQLSFEFDVDGQLTNPSAIRIGFTANDTSFQVASAIIAALNSQNVQAILDVQATRSNLALGDTDDRINLAGEISITQSTTEGFELLVGTSRGDSNRERLEQGQIIIENNRFLFSSESGIEVNRDARARVVGSDLRDEFPVALTYPQNLIELNTEGLIPGVVIQNNVLAYNANNGIRIQGVTDGGGARVVPVGFDQIVNNTLVGGVVLPGNDPGPQIFADFLFDRGGISFADEVVAVNRGPDVDSEFSDATAALSSPDCAGPGLEPADGRFTYSMGSGGSITLRFTDNFLTGNDASTPDLVVFETGASEDVRVEISRDGVTFFNVGTANAFRPAIDIDRFGFSSSDRFAYVRLTDLNSDNVTNAFGAAGADIDAVGALSTVPSFRYTPGSQGIFVDENAGPTILNNIVANFQTGIAVSGIRPDDDDVSRARTVIGGTTYFRNTFPAIGTDTASVGLLAQIPDTFEQIFVDPTRLLFTPQSQASTIDSSIDSLEERASLFTVRTAVGLPPVPILAPNFDLNGQLRVDDPRVDTPVGVGQRVFKDRGAEDRADSVAPRILLITPRGVDRLESAGSVVTTGTIFDSFKIQFIDGLASVDPGQGIGLDDGNVKGGLIRVTRQRSTEDRASTLVEGKDYRFAYEPGDNTIELTPIAGIWESEAVYRIELLGDDTGIIQGRAGTEYADGGLTQLNVSESVTRLLEVDAGINITVFGESLVTTDINGSQIANIQGQTLTVFDGHSERPIVFELITTNDPNVANAIVERGDIPVRVGQNATANQVASAIASAINRSSLKLFATAVESRIQLRDSVAKSTSSIVQTGEPAFVISAEAAYLAADIQISAELRGSEIHGKSIAVFDGTTETVFTLATNAGAVTGTRVNVSPSARTAEIATALAQAITASGLQVNATLDGTNLVLRGRSGTVDAETRLSYALPGVTIGDTAFKLTNFSLDVVLTQAVVTADLTQLSGFATVDGGLITIFDGQTQRTFEIDNNGVIAAGNIGVVVDVDATPREVINEIIATIGRTTDLNVSVVGASDRLRITGQRPISVTSANNSVVVQGLGSIGTAPGYGIQIPTASGQLPVLEGVEIAPSIVEGGTFTVSVGNNAPVVFEFDTDGATLNVGARLVSIIDRDIDAVANAIVQALTTIGVTSQNIGAGFVTIAGNVRVGVASSGLATTGIPGVPAASPVVVPLDATPAEVAAAYNAAIEAIAVPDSGNQSTRLQHVLTGTRVLIDGVIDITRNETVPLTDLRGTSVILERIADKANNTIDTSDDRGILTIFVGGGFDYGSAPAPYLTTAAQGGPRHLVDETFTLGATISPDADAVTASATENDGVTGTTGIRPGLPSSLTFNINNPNGRAFHLDAWFDWNANGLFEDNEVLRFGSAGTGRSVLGNTGGTITVNVPSNARVGETYARFRLSEAQRAPDSQLPASLPSIGDGGVGEVEDYRIVVTNNPFQNPVRPGDSDNRRNGDVNNSGFVSPLDALQLINALNRYQVIDPSASSIPLSEPLPTGFEVPEFPDVNGDGRISAADALEVIRILNALSQAGASGEGEAVATTFVPTIGGVMASQATWLGDSLSRSTSQASTVTTESAPPVANVAVSKTSVFDHQSVVGLDSVMDVLAEDNASARLSDDDESDAGLGSFDALDEVFAQL